MPQGRRQHTSRPLTSKAHCDWLTASSAPLRPLASQSIVQHPDYSSPDAGLGFSSSLSLTLLPLRHTFAIRHQS